MKKLSVFLVCFMMFLSLLDSAWGWTLGSHKKLANDTQFALKLPKPPALKRCEKPVDDIVLTQYLQQGSIEPDLNDGMSSPKHSFNKKYGSDWDSAIISQLKLTSNSVIGPGEALTAIEGEKAQIVNRIQGLTCYSSQSTYADIWKYFGRSSHYAADLASPLHVYSISANGIYREGDYINAEWVPGLFDDPIGKATHFFTEVYMGESLSNGMYTMAGSISPDQTASNSRAVLANYNSLLGNGTGFEGLVLDFLPTNLNSSFFKSIGKQQGVAAESAIKFVWEKALEQYTELNCDNMPEPSCEDDPTDPREPGKDHPDDNFSVADYIIPAISAEPIEKTWTKLAVKKGKQSLYWFWMQEYLFGLYQFGSIDEAKYNSLKNSYGLTNENAWSNYYNDFLTAPDVAVLGRGYAISMTDLLQNNFYEPVRRYNIQDFNPEAIKDYPVFVIPSGGLVGLENSSVFKANLAEYVKRGGTVVVFAQQHGYEFNALPTPDGKPINGYGWTEDQSCLWKGVYIDTYHQLLSSQNVTTISANVDGYFTSYPENSKILLRRTANGQPAMLSYEYGQGRVLVTSMFSDFAFKSKQATREEINIIRDIISWAKFPAILPEYKQTTTEVNLTPSIANRINTLDATQVKFHVLDPNRNIVLEHIMQSYVPAGQTSIIPLTFNISAAAPLGIWYVDYTLLDSQGNIIQPQAEANSGRFVVSNPPVNPYFANDLTFSINLPSEEVTKNQDVAFTVSVWNNSTVDKRLKIYSDWTHRDAIYLDEITVSANSSFSKNYVQKLPAQLYGVERLWVHFFEENGRTDILRPGYAAKNVTEAWPYAGSFGKGVSLITPSLDVIVQSDKAQYEEGETVSLAIVVKNSSSINVAAATKVRVTGPVNNELHSEILDTTLSRGESASRIVNFIIPAKVIKGSYSVAVEAFDVDDKKIGGNSTVIELPKKSIAVTSLLPAVFSSTNSVTLKIENTSPFNISLASLMATMTAPGGDIIWSTKRELTNLAPGESRSEQISIPLDNLRIGDYVFQYEIDTGDVIKRREIIKNDFIVTTKLDKISYRMREQANVSIDFSNIGIVSHSNIGVSIKVPDFGFSETKYISLLPAENSKIETPILIPTNILPGQHDLDVVVTLSSGYSSTYKSKIVVPESSLQLGYPGSEQLSPNSNIGITIQNTGGIDTDYHAEKITITDDKGTSSYETNTIGSILAGEQKNLITFQIPSQAAKGTYLLYVGVKDNKTGAINTYSKILNVLGIQATLDSRTEKSTYLKTENINSLNTVVNGNLNISTGVIDLQIKEHGETVGQLGNFARFVPKYGWTPLNNPDGVAVAPDKSVYVIDNQGWYTKIKKFDSQGNFLLEWGGQCRTDSNWDGVPDKECDGQFYLPKAIGVDSDGSVFVLDNGNYRIQKFDGNGVFITKWGSRGPADNQFNQPLNLAVAGGNVYVGDGSLVKKFDATGTFVQKWGGYTVALGDGQIYSVGGIAIGIDGSVFVTDRSWNRVQKFDSEGNFLLKWGSYGGFGSAGGLFNLPAGIVVGMDGAVYVADTNNKRIQKFDSNGVFLAKWGGTFGDITFTAPDKISISSDGFLYVKDSSRIQKLNSNGTLVSTLTSRNQFSWPEEIAVAKDGSIYVADTSNNKVQKFDKNGIRLREWFNLSGPKGIVIASDNSFYVTDSGMDYIKKYDANGSFVKQWGGYCNVSATNACDGKFNEPEQITIDANGYIYVTESGNHRVQKFDLNGNFVAKWGGQGTGDGQFVWPKGIKVSSDGFVYVVDQWNSRIQKFDLNGNFVSKWGGSCVVDADHDGINENNCEGFFSGPTDIELGPDGTIYIVDSYNNRIQKFDANGNFVEAKGTWGHTDGKFLYPTGIGLDSNGYIYVVDSGNNRIQRAGITFSGSGAPLFQTTIPVNQSAGSTQNYTANIGVLNKTGKLFLETKLKNNLGQIVSASEYPFYVVQGNVALLFSTAKKAYKPGEPITISGEVKNLGSVVASNLSLSINSDTAVIYSSSVNVPATSSVPFTTTLLAGPEGKVNLTGSVSQNSTTLVSIMDQYEVIKPSVTIAISAPAIVGRNPFDLIIELKNTGNIESSVQVAIAGGQFVDNQQLTIAAGQTKLLQYVQQITQNTTYNVSISGDVNQELVKQVVYGEAAQVQLSAASKYPEGKVGIPVTITNTGQIDEQVDIAYTLKTTSGIITQESKSYYLLKNSNVTDTLYYSLSKGEYELRAESVQPNVNAMAAFAIARENDLAVGINIGAQTGVLPLTIDLANNGWNDIAGTIVLSATDKDGKVSWSGEIALAQLLSGTSNQSTYSIDPGVLMPGAYVLTVCIYDTAGKLISKADSNLLIHGPVFTVTGPSNPTFTAGEMGSFAFKIKNAGNQEGELAFTVKAMDSLDSSVTEWLKPGEEKTYSVDFLIPADVEEKDYFAFYKINNEESGQVRFHVSGLNLSVSALLDKTAYQAGENAILTLNVTDRAGVSLKNLFARVNYSDYEEQKTFALTGSTSVAFTVPITKITGEKLFYGIYHEGGRSIHLNTAYIYESGSTLSIMTDKQVYNPGEVVTISIKGTVGGVLTLEGPGNYKESFDFTGSATKSLTLPAFVTAGTYYVGYNLADATGNIYTGRQPIDIAGIQVKVKEATLDKGKYASSDIVKLNMTIESNQNLIASLKTWVVNPDGSYVSAGSQEVSLTSVENSIITKASSISSVLSGIHQLVYGIYYGDMLLSSGSEAFDIGDGVLLGIALDKNDFPNGDEIVNVTSNLYGTVSGAVEFYIDNTKIKQQSVNLNGFVTLNTSLNSIQPGSHKLKVVFNAGGLSSSKEADFVYGSALPDLALTLTPDSSITNDNKKRIIISVINKGKTTSSATTVVLYDGVPARGVGTVLTNLAINSIAAGESVTFEYDMDLMGRAGGNILYAVVDSPEQVYEFNETKIQIGDMRSGGIYILTEIKDQNGSLAYSTNNELTSIAGSSHVTVQVNWDIPVDLAEGNYLVSQTVTAFYNRKNFGTFSRAITIKPGKDFTLAASQTALKIESGQTAIFGINAEPVRGFDEAISLTATGYPEGATVFFTNNGSVPPFESNLKIATSSSVLAGSYNVNVTGSGGAKTHSLDLRLEIADFEMTMVPSSAEIQELGNAEYQIDLSPLNGFESPVHLEVSGLPKGVKASFDKNDVSLPSKIVLKLKTSKWARPGNYEFIVTVTGTTAFHKKTLTLVINPNLSIKPGIVTVPGTGPQNKADVKLFTVAGIETASWRALESEYGANVAIGDIDGDGFDEIIVGSGPDTNSKAILKVFKKNGSPLNGAQVWPFNMNYGVNIAVGDIDGDWIEEIVVGTGPDPKGEPRVKVYKYNGLSLFDTGIDIYPYKSEGYKYGVNVSLADVDGDGLPEILTAPGPDMSASATVKAYKVNFDTIPDNWKVAGQSLEFTVQFSNKDGYGANMCAGDLDGDGIKEIIVASGPNPTNDAMVIKVYRADGTIKGESFNAYEGYKYGAFVACGDLDLDGKDEIITGAGPDPKNKSLIRLFKGDGVFLGEFFAYPDTIKYGVKPSVGRIGIQ